MPRARCPVRAAWPAADARDARVGCAVGRGLVVRDQVGRHPRARRGRARRGRDHEPTRQRPVGSVSRAGRPRRRRSTHRCCSTVRSWRSTPPAGPASRCCSSACTSPTRGARRSSPPRPRSRSWPSTCCGTQGPRCSTPPTSSDGRCSPSSRSTGPNWQTPASVSGAEDGAAMVAASQQLGLEGIVAKRSASRYEPGTRSRQWLKVKHRRQQELVVGGWVEGQGSRRGSIGALLVGYYDDARRPALRGSGRIGVPRPRPRRVDGAARRSRVLPATPFVDGDVAARRALRAPRSSSSRSRSPSGPGDGRLRHPVMLGRRDDVDPASVRREVPDGESG